MEAFGNQRWGLSAQSRSPATVARNTSPSSLTSRRRFRRAMAGFSARAALINGFHNRSFRVSIPVPGAG